MAYKAKDTHRNIQCESSLPSLFKSCSLDFSRVSKFLPLQIASSAFCLRLGRRFCDSQHLSVCLRTKWLKKKFWTDFEELLMMDQGTDDCILVNFWILYTILQVKVAICGKCAAQTLVEVCALSAFLFIFLFDTSFSTHLAAVNAELTDCVLSGSYSIISSIITFLLYSKMMCVLLVIPFHIFI